MKTFLKAHWKNLIMINFEVPKELLQPYVPQGTDIDLWKGKAYLSLVAFLFDKTYVLGIPALWNQKFEELNIRFYIKRVEDKEEKRGVAFIREIVPKPLVTSLANLCFSEHYETLKMGHKTIYFDSTKKEIKNLEYTVEKNGFHRVSARLTSNLIDLPKESFEEFIAEHYWGYSKVNCKKTIEYEVQHPKWRIFNGAKVSFNCDFRALYGEEWAFLNRQNPVSMFVAEGSEIKVGFPKTISW